MRPELRPAEVAAQLRELGVEAGGVLLVHCSYRAARPIADGPAGLIDGLLAAVGTGGTLVMPSFTGDDDQPFDPATTPASPDLGIVADTFWRLPGVLRSDHPFAFAAQGPRASWVVSDPVRFPPHGPESPIGRVHALDGQVLLIGVGHDANTTLHLAELLAGVAYRRPKHCMLLRDGRPRRVDYQENDHCCRLFARLDGWLRPSSRQAEGSVGHAHARLVRSADVVAAAMPVLKEDPTAFLHPESSGCEECDDAWKSLNG